MTWSNLDFIYISDFESHRSLYAFNFWIADKNIKLKMKQNGYHTVRIIPYNSNRKVSGNNLHVCMFLYPGLYMCFP